MILKINSKVNCEQSNINDSKSKKANPEIERTLKKVLLDNGSNKELDQDSDGTINLNNLSAIEFHSLQLRLEEQGIPFEIERATLIHIAV